MTLLSLNKAFNSNNYTSKEVFFSHRSKSATVYRYLHNMILTIMNNKNQEMILDLA